jgi:hypothetical protein
MTRLYVAGPMRGYPEFNFPEFDKATDQLRVAGYDVFSPAEHDRSLYGDDVMSYGDSIDIRISMAADLDWICKNADGVALLHGWTASKGACAEYALALALDIPARPVGVWLGKVGPRTVST